MEEKGGGGKNFCSSRSIWHFCGLGVWRRREREREEGKKVTEAVTLDHATASGKTVWKEKEALASGATYANLPDCLRSVLTDRIPWSLKGILFFLPFYF